MCCITSTDFQPIIRTYQHNMPAMSIPPTGHCVFLARFQLSHYFGTYTPTWSANLLGLSIEKFEIDIGNSSKFFGVVCF
ncbi:hypothetical protein AQUCO_04500071v1 [Aquilegia coerulea]|uniref:Uncharacterized protein n=1 Tax=Aquilegia coerulea TaxID=218851 RepID=A0A2G5CLV0_AQUCA|nr:hypothetical protein AQUCO_04500071v1 [Aquilegia coerulea]